MDGPYRCSEQALYENMKALLDFKAKGRDGGISTPRA
jgi:hypothetical protein